MTGDMPDYEHFLLELYRSSESHPQYLGGKIVSSWQSCTLMLSVVGCFMLGTVLSLGRVLVKRLVSGAYAVEHDIWIFLGLAALYLLTGLASLERNRLLVRDVLMSYVLRKQKTAEQSPPANPSKASDGPTGNAGE